MNNQDKTKEQLIKELRKSQNKYDSLKEISIRDFTERNQSEEIIVTEKRRLSDILKGTNVGTWEWNIQTGETVFDENWAKIIGYQLEEISPISIETWKKFSHPDDAIVSGELLEKHFNGQLDYYEFEARMKHKNGYWIWVLDKGKVHKWDDGGKPLLMSGTHQDITIRKQTEEKLVKAKKLAEKQNKKLKNLNAQKDKFFSIIAHDLKSPFNSILGFSSLLTEQIKEKNYDGVEEYAKIIEMSSNRAIDLLMNLMEWSRSQTGRMEFNPEHFEMINLIDEVILLFDDIAAQKNISINTNKFPSNALIFADKDMTKTILRNLISNAIKFTHTGGEIIILTDENKKELTVSVSDNGIGISKSKLKTIFLIGENHTTSGTNKEKGTGLGLILCKEFVEIQEGNIWTESEQGKGSTFYFTLPKEAKTKENN